jgi:hypothetical protein
MLNPYVSGYSSLSVVPDVAQLAPSSSVFVPSARGSLSLAPQPAFPRHNARSPQTPLHSDHHLVRKLLEFGAGEEMIYRALQGFDHGNPDHHDRLKALLGAGALTVVLEHIQDPNRQGQGFSLGRLLP